MKNLFLLIVIAILANGLVAQSITNFPVATGNDSTISWGIAYSGANFLIPIVGDMNSNYSLTYQMLAIDGSLLGSRVSLSNTGSIMQALWDGSRYFIVAQSVSGSGFGGQFISQNGSLDGNFFMISMSGHLKEGSTVLAQTDQEILVVFRNTNSTELLGQRISKQGSLIGSPFVIATGINIIEYAVCSKGDNYLVAWYDHIAGGNNPIYARLINVDGSPITNTLTILTGNYSHNPLSVTTDGSQYFVVYDVEETLYGPHSVYGKFVSGSTGDVGQAIAIAHFVNNVSNSMPSAAFNNGKYLVTWHAWYMGQQGVDSLLLKGAILDANGDLIVDQYFTNNPFVIASPVNGKMPLGFYPIASASGFAFAYNQLIMGQQGLTDGDGYVAFISYQGSGIHCNEKYADNFNLNVFPNPVTANATIQFSLTHSAMLTLEIADMSGKVIETLLAETLPEGTYQVHCNTDQLSDGVYYCIIKTKDHIEHKKLVIVR